MIVRKMKAEQSTLEENKFNLPGETIDAMLKAMASLPPVKADLPTLEFKETCACGKKVPVTDLMQLNTGVIVMPNDVCKGCKEGMKMDKEMARVVCIKCKRVIGRIKPTVDKQGFEFKAGKTYHMESCGHCDPDRGKYMIIEKYIHSRKSGRK